MHASHKCVYSSQKHIDMSIESFLLSLYKIEDAGYCSYSLLSSIEYCATIGIKFTG